MDAPCTAGCGQRSNEGCFEKNGEGGRVDGPQQTIGPFNRLRQHNYPGAFAGAIGFWPCCDGDGNYRDAPFIGCVQFRHGAYPERECRAAALRYGMDHRDHLRYHLRGGIAVIGLSGGTVLCGAPPYRHYASSSVEYVPGGIHQRGRGCVSKGDAVRQGIQIYHVKKTDYVCRDDLAGGAMAGLLGAGHRNGHGDISGGCD